MGPIAHGEPSASQAAELRSCYLSSLDLLLEHRLRSAVRGGRAPGGGGLELGEEGPPGGGRRVTLSPIPSHLPRPPQAFPCISTGVFGELGRGA